MAFFHLILELRSMSAPDKTSHIPVITTMATDMDTSAPTWSATHILVIRPPTNGLTLQLTHTRLRIRLGTWAETRCARTGTRTWIYRSSANFRLPNDFELNFVSRRLT